MSKQELAKWKNKRLLYLKLHPGWSDADCGEICKGHCTKLNRMSVEGKNKNSMLFTDNENMIWCIEWVRYV